MPFLLYVKGKVHQKDTLRKILKYCKNNSTALDNVEIKNLIVFDDEIQYLATLDPERIAYVLREFGDEIATDKLGAKEVDRILGIFLANASQLKVSNNIPKATA